MRNTIDNLLYELECVDWWKIIMTAIVVVGSLFLVYMLVSLVVLIRAEAFCLEHGYNEAATGFNLKPYCSKLVNATHVVVPLREVISGG